MELYLYLSVLLALVAARLLNAAADALHRRYATRARQS